MMTGIILTVVIIGLIVIAGVMYKNRHRTIANVAEDKANDVKDFVDKTVDKAKVVVKDIAKDAGIVNSLEIGKKIEKRK